MMLYGNLKRFLITPIGRLVWRFRSRYRNTAAMRKARLLKRLPSPGERPLRIAYVHPYFPLPPSKSPIGGGGAVKFLWLEKRLPHGFPECDALYAVSSAFHEKTAEIFAVARSLNIPIIWNQDGAYFPHSYGTETVENGNRKMGALFHTADYVLYQSEFARESSHHFLGPYQGDGEVLYNAIDTAFYAPDSNKRNADLTLLAAGSHDDPYRIPLVLDVFGQALTQLESLRLIIAGRIKDTEQDFVYNEIGQRGWGDIVEVVGPYSPSITPNLFNRAHIFLHVKYSDVCPSVVLEAMACGLPVVFSATGGTPELVGDAGIGIPTEQDWETPRPPSAESLANAIVRVASNLEHFSSVARQRAVSKFDINPWLERHDAVFRELIDGRPS